MVNAPERRAAVSCSSCSRRPGVVVDEPGGDAEVGLQDVVVDGVRVGERECLAERCGRADQCVGHGRDEPPQQRSAARVRAGASAAGGPTTVAASTSRGERAAEG